MEPENEVVVVDDSGDAPEVDNSETTVEAPDAVVEASPTIIVETAPEPESVPESEIDRAVQTAERLTALEGVVGGLVNAVAELSATAQQAQQTADVAVDVAVEAIQETAEVAEELEEDEAPSDSGPHWWFESRADRRKRKGKD